MDVPAAPQTVLDGACALGEEECGKDSDLASDDHLMNLKALAEKLRLETRRPSYLEWRAQLEAANFREPRARKGLIQADPDGKPKETVVNCDPFQCKMPSGVLKGFGNIDEALAWLKKELVRYSFNSSQDKVICCVFCLRTLFSICSR